MSRLSIKSKLLIMLLSVSALSIAAVASLNYAASYDTLRESVFSHLTSVRASRAHQLEQYIQRIQSEVLVLGSAAGLGAAAVELIAAFNALEEVELEAEQLLELENFYRTEFMPQLAAMIEGDPELTTLFPETNAARYLQYHYLARNPYPVGNKLQLQNAKDGSEYSRIHAAQHAALRRIVDGFGLYDLFLIDIESGAIIYSTAKEIDFGTNLVYGPQAQSGLGRLFRKVQRMPDRGSVQFIDFAYYRPSYGEPAMFVAVPIFDSGKPVAVLAVQESTAELDQVMSHGGKWERDGLGKTGETILVGPDYLMRSGSRFLVEDPERYAENLRAIATPEDQIQRMLTLGSPILELEVRTQAAEEAIRGRTGTGILTDYRGVEILGSWAPLKLEDLDWAIVGKMDLQEAFAPIHDLARDTLIQTAIILGVITLVVMLLANSFVRPVNDLIARIRRFTAGDADVDFEGHGQDEISDLARSFRQLVISAREQTHLIEQVSNENERLLSNMLPSRIAQRVKHGDEEVAETVSDVSVIFVEFRGLVDVTLADSSHKPITILKAIIAATDAVAAARGVERIKVMADTYMAAVGLSAPLLDHMRRAVEFARDVRDAAKRIGHEYDADLGPVIAISAGRVVTDVEHDEELLFHLWGEPVIRADHARDHAERNQIVVTEVVYDKLGDAYAFEPIASDSPLTLWTLADDADEERRPDDASHRDRNRQLDARSAT